MKKLNKDTPQKKTNQINERSLLIGFLLLILLHVFGGFWHSYYSWGFSYWSVLSTNTIIVSGILSIIALFVTYYYRSNINLDFIDRLQVSYKSKFFSVIFYSLILLLVTFILYILRSKAHYYGDGFLVIDKILETKEVLAESKNFMELFTIYFYYYVTLIVQQFGSFSSEIILGVVNSIAGAFGVWAILSISKLLGDSPDKVKFIFVTAFTSATIILFFGYIENYTLALTSGLWAFRFTLGYVKKENSILPLIILSFLSIGFHLITLPFLLVALYAIIVRTNKIKFISKLQNFSLAIIFLIGTLIVVYGCQIKGYTIFVPLWTLQNNSYSLLSLAHITDVFNQLILVAPLGLLFVMYVYSQRKIIVITDLLKIIIILSYLIFLTACFIDPQLGAVRDWDLLSFYGIPLTILFGYLLAKYYDDHKFPQWIIIATLIIGIVHIVPNIYEKNHPEIALEYLDKVLRDDPHYQSNYQNAYRGNSWGYMLRKFAKRDDLAEKYFTRRRNANTKDFQPYYNLGVMYLEKENYDSAQYYLQEGFDINPQGSKFLSKLAFLEFSRNNLEKAEMYARKSLEIDSTDEYGLMYIGQILTTQGRNEEAIFYTRKLLAMNSSRYKFSFTFGILFSKLEQYDSTFYYFDKAVDLVPGENKATFLGDLVSISWSFNNKSKAKEYLEQLKAIAPNSELVREKEKEIYGK